MPERYVAYKTELKLNNQQASFCARHAGTARWSFNWALRRCIDVYQATEKRPTAIDLHREIIAMKKTPEYSWLKAVSKCSPQSALRDLDQAFKNYFNSLQGGKLKSRHPQFKRKRIGEGSFRLEGTIHIADGWIQLPKLGRLRLKQRGYFPTDDQLRRAGEKVLSVTVSERAGHWFCSIKILRKVPEPIRSENQTVGVDLGFKNVAVLSDGTVYPSHQFHIRQLKRLRYLNKKVARAQKGSQNWRKAMMQYRRLHYRIANQRNDQLHKITTHLVRNFGTVVIETLNVSGMHRNPRLSKRAHDSALYEFTRQLEYKAEWAGVEIIRASMWYPSSQLCSRCGERHRELTLRDSTFCCPACGFTVDRDLNAARNLKDLAKASMAAGAAVTACGDIVRPGRSSAASGRTSAKQEIGRAT
ncbi:hypothetical protein LCGC14_0468820 [marine sediment metagenome]|uniref:Transposase n=1 Tax=marine sediment metagenome TaxID=412755 RepID=A0A0F9UZJ1_9ZZZZ